MCVDAQTQEEAAPNPPTRRPRCAARSTRGSRESTDMEFAGARTGASHVQPSANAMPLHVKARSQGNPLYPRRSAVEDSRVPWDVPFNAYAPVAFTHKSVIAQGCDTVPGGWADPLRPLQATIEARGSHELQARMLHWQYDSQGRPLNPRGRTGMCERGCLGKWGPNHAGDAIVTRHRLRRQGEATPPGGSRVALEMVAIKRRDTGEWAIPGGMADPSEVGKAALIREFKEEAGAVEPEEMARFVRASALARHAASDSTPGRHAACATCRHAAMPPCCCAAMPPCCCAAKPPCCCAAMPPCRHAAVPPCRHAAMLCRHAA